MYFKQKALSLVMISVILAGLGLNGCSVASKGKTESASQTPAPAVSQVEAFAKGQDYVPAKPDTAHSIAPYFIPATTKVKTPDPEGFIQRWLLLEPIKKPIRFNNVLSDSYIRTAFTTEYFPNQFTVLPKDKEQVIVGEQLLTWHALESTMFNVKLFRFAYGLRKQIYGVLFWAVTVVNCPEEMKNVRMSVGSNASSMWWLNGKEVAVLSGDIHMVQDYYVTARLTLNKGKNIIRGAVINGPGMSDFCVRFLDENGEPVKNITISCE